MIVWRGWGVLALLIAGAGAGLGTLLAAALGLDTSGANVGTGLGLLLGAAGIWVVGTRLNAPRPGFDASTGERVLYRNMHTLMFIPMQWLAPAVGVIGVWLIISASLA